MPIQRSKINSEKILDRPLLKSKESSKEKSYTGNQKETALYSRTLRQLSWGIVCKYCKKDSQVITYSHIRPLYCNRFCRQLFHQEKAKQDYYQNKNK